MARLAELESAALPVLPSAKAGDDINVALLHLRRPFAPTAVKWKVQTVTNQGNGALVVGHLDARLVIERLNAVVGGAWFPRYVKVDGGLECELTVFDVTRGDVGMASGMLAPKALRSDALKRAAVLFGVGVSIYALQAVKMEVGADPHQLRTRKQKKQDKWIDAPDLDASSRSYLADRYAKWLEVRGTAAFGPVLDHGDQDNPAGMDDGDAPADTEQAQEAASPEAEAERERALAQAQGKQEVLTDA